MQTYTIHSDQITYTRISKQAARRRFNEGKNVYVIARKMRPGRPFSMGCVLYGDMFEHEKDNWRYADIPMDDRRNAMFEHFLREFTWYNCSYETGYYPAFYIES